jgi:hypothetical protein
MTVRNICMSYGVANYAPESNEPIDNTALMPVLQNSPLALARNARRRKNASTGFKTVHPYLHRVVVIM